MGTAFSESEEVSFRRLVKKIPSTTHATFGLYRYPAKFIPQVIAYILENYAKPGMTILDPFAGCGTVGLVARLYGCHYELWDLNPILKELHDISVMKPVELDLDELIYKMSVFKVDFAPLWSNVSYWYPPEVLPFLKRLWGFYHSLPHSPQKQVLLVPLLKLSRLFSYNDPQRQKLSKSPRSLERVQSLMQGDWKRKFFEMLKEEVKLVLRKLQEYQNLLSVEEGIRSVILSGVDAVEESNHIEWVWDILITSPPYLQAQEYIRFLKIDLFWLGYSEEQVRDLQAKELPYRDVEAIPIYSETYQQWRKMILEPHMFKVFERYFHGVLRVLTNLSSCISSRLFLFIGPATIRAQPIPIDRIFIEHFTSLGFKCEATLIDSIVARVMFRSKVNPATGLEDKRIPTERLVILKR